MKSLKTDYNQVLLTERRLLKTMIKNADSGANADDKYYTILEDLKQDLKTLLYRNDFLKLNKSQLIKVLGLCSKCRPIDNFKVLMIFANE